MFRTIFKKIKSIFGKTPEKKSKSKKPAAGGKTRKNAGSAASRPAAPARRNRPEAEARPRKEKTAGTERRVLSKKITVPQKPEMPPLEEIPSEEGKTRFQDLALAPEVLAGTQSAGFKYCTVIQEKCLPFALDHRDLAAKAQTGTGKTAAFLASSMTELLKNPKENRRPRTCRVLVLEPTRELAMQIEKDADQLGKYTGLYCKAIFGGIDYKAQREALENPVDILACTPGRLLDYVEHGALDISESEILVIDEADRMLDMGFIPDVRRIISKLPPAGKRQTMLFSATLEPEILRLADRWLVDPVMVEAEKEHVVTDLIDQKFFAVMESQKIPFLVHLVRTMPFERMIVFGNMKFKNTRICEELLSYGIECEQLSGDVAQEKRIKVLDRFKEGKCRVLIATDVAARGLHVEGISHVVNFDLPEQAEDYVHRIGRTGRAGHTGTSISFVCEFGAFNVPAIEEYTGMTIKTVQPLEEELILPERVRPLKEVRVPEHGAGGGRGSFHRSGGSMRSGHFGGGRRRR